MTLARGTDLNQQHETHLAIKAGRIMRGWTQAQMAELMADFTGSDEWTEARITAVENGRKRINHRDLRAFGEVQGYDVEFYWYGPPANRRRELRDLNSSNPGYDSFAPTDTRHEAYLLNSGRARVDHRIGDCIDCAMNPGFHVAAEWLEVPGQLTIDLRDEALERFLQGAA